MEIYKDWLSKYNWDFFTTTTYENPKISINSIRMKFDDYYNNFWIKQIVWCLEFTNTGLPHVHCLINTNNAFKSKNTLTKMLKKQGNTIIKDFKYDYGNVYDYSFKDCKETGDWNVLGLENDKKNQLRNRYEDINGTKL